nr:hypothetical protein [Actinomycetes bacterium]
PDMMSPIVLGALVLALGIIAILGRVLHILSKVPHHLAKPVSAVTSASFDSTGHATCSGTSGPNASDRGRETDPPL